jgi:hypothetical protein
MDHSFLWKKTISELYTVTCWSFGYCVSCLRTNPKLLSKKTKYPSYPSICDYSFRIHTCLDDGLVELAPLLGLRSHQVWRPSTFSCGATLRTLCTYHHCLKTLATWRITFRGLLQQLSDKWCRMFGRKLTIVSVYAVQREVCTLNFRKHSKKKCLTCCY